MRGVCDQHGMDSMSKIEELAGNMLSLVTEKMHLKEGLEDTGAI